MKQLLAEYIKTLMEIDDSMSIDEAPIPKKYLDVLIPYVDKRNKKREATVLTIQKKGKGHSGWDQYQRFLSDPEEFIKGLEGDGESPEPESAPEEEPTATEPKSDEEPKDDERTAVDTEEAYRKLYGEDNSGPLLQGGDSDAQTALERGYRKDAPWVAPGNGSSNFNENLSLEGVLILEKYPNLTDEQLADIIYRRTGGTALSRQVGRISPFKRIEYPKGLTDSQQKHYSACVVAARSARKKADRSTRELEGVPEDVFGKERTNTTYGGTATDLENLSNALRSAQQVYIYDSAVGLVPVDQDAILAWVAASGGGENAADTVTLTTDQNGNVLFQGWSDKTSITDIQANSTVMKELSNAAEVIATLEKEGRIDRKTALRAREVALGFRDEIREIEEGYSLISKKNAEYYLGLDDEELREWGEYIADKERSNSTSKHFNNFMAAIDKAITPPFSKSNKPIRDIYPQEEGESDEEYSQRMRSRIEKEGAGFYLRTLAELAQRDLITQDEQKIVVRLAQTVRAQMRKAGEEIPDTLNTIPLMSSMRKKALDAERELYRQLDEIPARTRSGKETTVGALVGFQDVMKLFHLDKIDEPTDEKDIPQILRRNTQLMMEGQAYTAEDLKDCLGVESTRELEDKFEVVVKSRYTKGKEKGAGAEEEYISGAVVVIYAFDSKGKKVEVGYKELRPKQGPQSKTETSIKWSRHMRDCFKSKGS